MKNSIILILLTFLLNYSGHSGRVITSFDIARWYLDSDLVVSCTVNRIDTMQIRSYDSVGEDSIHRRYDIVREKYSVTLDSIIKGNPTELHFSDTILTPEFSINYSAVKYSNNKEFIGIDTKGDSIIESSAEMLSEFCDDSGSFRLQANKEKHVVILSKTIAGFVPSGFVIDYQTECDEGILKLIAEINEKGKSYIFPGE